MLSIVLFLPLRILNSTTSWSLQPRWSRSLQLLQPWSSHLNLSFLKYENNWIAYVLLCCPSSCHVVQDPREDLSLQTWDFFQLSEEGIIYFFLISSLQQTPKTMSSTNPNLLSAGPSSIPKQNFTYPCCSLIQRATLHPCLSGLSFLKSLCSSTAALQPHEVSHHISPNPRRSMHSKKRK